MLNHTFCHIAGIDLSIEKLLWANGIKSWDAFMAGRQNLDFLVPSHIEVIAKELPNTLAAFKEQQWDYFKKYLPRSQQWRLAPHCKVAYVDIETTGLRRDSSQITVIGIYDGNQTHSYIQGVNLSDADEKLREFDAFVTFNGKQFDLPFIERHFNCKYSALHFDLRYMLKELGLAGGLKSIERQLGIQRGEDAEGVDGFEAIRLWSRYQRGDRAALDRLIAYNQADVENLKTLLYHYVEEKLSSLMARGVE